MPRARALLASTAALCVLSAFGIWRPRSNGPKEQLHSVDLETRSAAQPTPAGRREWAVQVPPMATTRSQSPALPPNTMPPAPSDIYRRMPQCVRAVSCGMALACVRGRCAECLEDRECGRAEVCAVGRCLRAELALCRRNEDCPGEDVVCQLGEISSDSRGNGSMRSECLNLNGGRPEIPVPPPRPDERDMRQVLGSLDELNESVRRAALGQSPSPTSTAP